MKTLKISLFLIFILCAPVHLLTAQVDPVSEGIKLPVYATKKAQCQYKKKLKKHQRVVKKLNKNKSFRLTPLKIDELVNGAMLNESTLKDYINSLREESRTFAVDFFNKKNLKGMEFSDFYELYKDSTLFSIQNWYKSILTDSINKIIKIDISRQANSMLTFADFQNGEDLTLPYIDNLKEALTITKNYSGQYRDVSTTANQSIYLQGRYYDNVHPYFPDYKNLQCKNCCGPAAGGSILEWWNVPVKKEDGSLCLYPQAVQRQLSDEMDTEDGYDYTHFLGLVSVLNKSKYRGNKLINVTYGSGELNYIKDLLIQGSPVILLLAWKGNIHYATVYGYSADTNMFLLANSNENLSSKELLKRWSWASAKWEVKYILTVSGHLPFSSFSYSLDNRPIEWDYQIPLQLSDFQSISDPWYEKYYEIFNNEYIGSNENQQKLNFYARPGFDELEESFQPYAFVYSGNTNIELGEGNSRIIFSNDYPNRMIPNNSINKHISVRVFADSVFIKKHMRNSLAQWTLRNKYGKSMLPIGTRSPNDTIGNKFVYDFPQVYSFYDGRVHHQNSIYYSQDYTTLDFTIGGGFRKLSWELLPCNSDYDSDEICDEFDDDIDNDGILNDQDNCIKGYNPDQCDNDNDGIGYYCDCDEKCVKEICRDGNLIFYCPDTCEKLLCPDWEISYMGEFLENLQDLRRYWPIKRIEVNPNDPQEVLKGKIAFWFLNRRIDRILHKYPSPILESPELKIEILRGLLIKDPEPQFSHYIYPDN